MLTVVYLIFDEGYTASSGDGLVREDLCTEAIRLERLLAELMPDEPEVTGLLALLARRWLASKWHANSPKPFGTCAPTTVRSPRQGPTLMLWSHRRPE